MHARHLAALAIALVTSPSLATPAPVPVYLLSMHFDDGEQLSGHPRLEVRAGEQATIEVGNEGRNIFNMEISVTPATDGLLHVKSTLDAVSLAGVHRRASPALLVRPGQAASVAFGEESATVKPVRVTFTVTPVPSLAR